MIDHDSQGNHISIQYADDFVLVLSQWSRNFVELMKEVLSSVLQVKKDKG